MIDICVLSINFTYGMTWKIRYGTRYPQFRVRVSYVSFDCSLKLPKMKDFDYIQRYTYPKEWIIEYMQAYLKQT